jgi:hypothetical protein
MIQMLPLKIFAFFILVAGPLTATEEKTWVVGYDKVGGDCKPVGGLTTPGKLPFQYASLDDCEDGKQAANFNSALKQWKGYILEEDVCTEVSAHADFNPFQLTKDACDAERKKLTTAVASLDKRDVRLWKRDITQADGLEIAKVVMQTSMVALGMVFPYAKLLGPIASFLWPSKKPDVWSQVRGKVKELINQKMDEAYANDLENFLQDLKEELRSYNALPDGSVTAVSKIVSIDTSLGVRSRKFMNVDDPMSTLTYFIPYVSLRLSVEQELIRVSEQLETK